jgi:(2Fe-2S) ferredoxin
MSRIERHLFVCQNTRPEGGKPSCGSRGGAEVFAALQRAIGADPSLWGRIAATPCGCLGPCFEGPTLVVYPEGVWYVGVTAQDVPEIVDKHLKRGEILQRLLREED